ncbi:MAG TPA: hypothetical protein VGM37_00985 [Armatimonadota bacterium]|jgi:hypothetical protein
MRIGVAQADITPEPGGELCGFVAREQPSLGVHDRLLATVLYLESGGVCLPVMHAEVIGHDGDMHKFIWRFEGEYRGWPYMLLTATHTHSGPPSIRLYECGEYDAAYCARLRDTLYGLFQEARANAEEAALVVAEARCDLGIDRRGGPHAHTDPRLPVLGWKRADGSWVAAAAVYAMHNVAMGPQNRLVSGDVAGEAARRLSEIIGAPAIFLNGACGNINPPSVGSDFARVDEWGERLAAAAGAALEAAPPVGDETLRVGGCEWEAARLPAPPEHIAALEAEFAAAGEGPTGDRIRRAFERWRNEPVEDEVRLCGQTYITVVRLGPIYLACFDAEVFSHIGDELRAATGLPVYPVGYANGDVGYVAPEWAYHEGGYETQSAFVYYGTKPIERGAYEYIRDQAAAAIQRLSRA